MEWLFPWRELSRRPLAFFSLLLPLLFGPCLPPSAAAAFSAATLGDYDNVTVMQVSGSYDVAYLNGSPDLSARREIAKEFYRTHGDDYDFLVIFTNFNFAMPPGAKAFFSTAKNDVRGIGVKLNGQELYDYTNAYSPTGSYLARLNGTIDMANVVSHVLEPADPEFDDTLMTLTHEFLHRWGAYVHFKDGANDSNALLGLGDAHWSYLLDSKGSTLYGNHWRDNGDGTFTTVAPEQIRAGEVIGRIFSPLDLYLMGLIDKTKVPPLLLIDAPGIDRNQLPAVGGTIPGVARTVTIDDIIAAEGERVPASAESRKEFRTAFIYAVIPGTWSAGDAQDRGEVAAINRLKLEWEKRFSILTDGTAMMRTAIVVPEAIDTNPGVTTPTVTPAVTPSVNSGVNWLVSRQQPGGYWQDQPGTDRRDTAAAVAALKVFPAGLSAAAGGQGWLATVSPENSDFLARKLLGLNSASVTELVALQNLDGGWGSAPGYASNPVDTALVLQALNARGGADSGVLAAAVNYLHGQQSPDGGWNTGRGGSMVQPSARALLALNSHRGSYPLEPAIADGLAWLSTHRNGDGGFGNSPSTVIDTSLALQALKATGSAPAAASNAVSYLLARQSSTGSWNDSVFQTAQAVEALYAGQVAADLAVAMADISFNPATVSVVPTPVAVTVTVHNLGSNTASSVKVALYENDPAPANLLGEKTINVPGSGSASATFSVTVSAFGLHSYYAVIDGGNQVIEANEWNNTASKTLAANLPPPSVGFALSATAGSEAVTSVPLTVSHSYPWTAPITVNYSVDAASTATTTADYFLAAGTLTFAADETSKTINLAIVNDLVAEIDKTVIIDLSSPSLGTLGTSRHTYTIRDDEPPAVAITSPPAGLTGQSAPQLLYTTTGGDVVVKVDGSIVSKLSGNTLGPFADGAHFVEVSASNSFGTVTTARVDFSVDTSVPTVTIVSPLTGTYPGDTLPLFYQIDGGEVSRVLLDSQPTAVRSGGSLGPLGDGEHQVSITAVDSAGNSVVATRAFVVARNGSATPGQEELPPERLGSREIIRTSYYERGVMKVDAVGNAYLATLRLGSFSGYDVLVYKFDRNGRPLWPAPVTINFPFNSDLVGLEVDPCGNAYVFGRTKSTFTSASGSIGEDWDYDLYAAKVSNSGTLAWSYAWGSIQTDFVYAGCLTKNGTLYLTGKSEGPIDGSYGDNPGQEMFITIFDAAGNRLHNKNYPTPAGWAIAADEAGNIFFSNGASLQKYSPSGQLLWSKPYVGTSRIAIDRQGNVILGKSPLQKIDPVAGALLWSANAINAQPFPGKTPYPPGIDWLGIDDNDSIYVLGVTNQQLDGHQSLDGNDPYLAKFDRQGRKLWVEQLDTPMEGTFTGGFAAGDGHLYAARTRGANLSSAPDYVFMVDEFVPLQPSATAGSGVNYYLAPASACSGISYSQAPVSVRLNSAEAECATPDQLAMNFKGSKDMLVAYLANGGYPLAADVELAAFGNALTLLASDSAGTATVTLLEVEPASGSGLRTLATKTFPLTAGKATVIRDLSGLAGRIAAGKSFGIRLTMNTTARSNNRIAWGSAFDCPTGSRQYLRVTERPVDGEAPYSTLQQPVEGAHLPGGCTLVTGSAGDGTGSGVGRVEVSADGGRSWQFATDTSADQRWSGWAYPWCPSLSGRYLLHSRATDRTGNVEPLNPGVTVTFGSYLPAKLSVTPDTISQGVSTAVALTVAQFDPAVPAIPIKLVRDVGGDGSPVNDPFVRLFAVQDGIASNDPNVPGDQDGQVNGRIVTTLNFNYLNDVQMVPGDYVFVADTSPAAVAARFTVTAASQPQTIQGYVLDPQGVSLGGATVQLLDKWGQSHGYAFTDSAGHYLFNVAAPGDYLLLPTRENFAFAKANLVPRPLTAGQQLTVDLPMVAGTYTVDGQVRDAGSSAQLAGGILVRAESSQYVAAPMPRAYGSYGIDLPAGEYQLYADAYTTQGAAAQGYMGSRAPLGQVTVTATSTGNHLPLSRATTLVCGQVCDSANLGVAGLVVEAVSGNGSGRFATAVTDGEGHYCLGLMNDGNWQVALNDSADQPLGYVGTAVAGVTATAGPFNGVDLTAYPVGGAIGGSVKEETQPVAGLAVKATCATTGVVVTGRTAADGSYCLGVHTGAWQIALAAEALGYEPVAPATVTVDDGGAASWNFAVSKPVRPANTIAITKAAYDTRKKVLNVEASSSYQNANLQVVGYGPMTYSRLSKGKHYWVFSQGMATKPATVTVSGPEGSKTATVQ